MIVVNNGLTIEFNGAFGHFPKEFVVSALEKQIPKKPWKPFITSKNIFACSCNHAVSKGDKYCTVCGQALDWSDAE